MQKAVYKKKTIKKHFEKSGVVKIYTDIQYRFAERLENDSNVKSFETNIKVLNGEYTTDFFVIYMDDSQMAFDCLDDKSAILRPRYVSYLDAIKSEWLKKGVEWALVIPKE